MHAQKLNRERMTSRNSLQRSRDLLNHDPQKNTETTNTFSFQDNRPEIIPQRKLYEIANNNHQAHYASQFQTAAADLSVYPQPESNHGSKKEAPNSQFKVSPLIPREVGNAAGEKVAQLTPTEVRITGVTHLVMPKGESIFEGKIGKQLDNSDSVMIEPDQSLWSRRGPNQEIRTNRDLIDRKGLHVYEWFRVLDVQGREFDKNSFLRDQTFVPTEPIRDMSVDEDLTTMISKQGMKGVYEKAHGEGSVSEITEAQHAYQEWLQDKMSWGEIMDRHRSVGFEYEFATYCDKNGKSPKVPVHQEIGKSANLSSLFNIPFSLETDSNDEIEAVMPPFLIADTGAEINKGAADKIYKAYRSSLKDLRDENKPGNKEKPKLLAKLVNKLEASGLGKGWSFSGMGAKLYLSGQRKKHSGSEHYIYSQMNISMTPEEMADITETGRGAEEAKFTTHADVVLANAAVKDALHIACASLFGRLAQEMDIRKSEKWMVRQNVFTAITNMSKGFAGLVAIPSILADNERKEQDAPISSSVKEFSGMWLKDSIPNIVDSSLPDAASRNIMLEVVLAAQNGIRKGMDSTVDNQIEAMRSAMEKTYTFGKKGKADKLLKGFLAEYKLEYKATMEQVLARLQKKVPKMQKVKGGSEFENEAFGGKGLGVRKDTFVNIKSGDQRRMHLAELRNDDAIRMLLYGRRKRRKKK